MDQADEQEREALKKERIELFQKRKEKRVQLKCLEQKLQRVEVVCLLVPSNASHVFTHY